jgi:hypothetical protein
VACLVGSISCCLVRIELCIVFFVGECFRVRIRKGWDGGVREGKGGVVYYIGSVLVYSFINS